jgi:hypothetical protein
MAGGLLRGSDAEIPEAAHDGVRVEVAAGACTGEEPGAVGAGARAEVRSGSEMVPQERGERFGDFGGVPTEVDAHAGVAVVNDSGWEGDDLDEWLTSGWAYSSRSVPATR